jgi:hypothetical protein
MTTMTKAAYLTLVLGFLSVWGTLAWKHRCDPRTPRTIALCVYEDGQLAPCPPLSGWLF